MLYTNPICQILPTVLIREILTYAVTLSFLVEQHKFITRGLNTVHVTSVTNSKMCFFTHRFHTKIQFSHMQREFEQQVTL
jgi:predicted membrane protein